MLESHKSLETNTCFHEEVFEGSRIANRQADEQKCHRRLSPLGELAQHNTTCGSRGTVNDTVAAGQFTVLSGEVCEMAVRMTKGV